MFFLTFFKEDPYTSIFRNLKNKAFDKLGIEMYCDNTPVNSIYKSFTLKDVHIKLKGQDKELFTSSSITFNQSLISSISTVLLGTYPFSFTITDADIFIDSQTKIDSNSETNTNNVNNTQFDILNFFSNFRNGFEATTENVNLLFLRDDGEFYLNGLNANVKLDSDLNFKKLNFNFNSVGFTPLKEGLISPHITTHPLIDENDNATSLLSVPISLNTLELSGYQIKTDNLKILFTSDEYSNVEKMGISADLKILKKERENFITSFNLEAFLNLKGKSREISLVLDNITINNIVETFKLTSISNNFIFKGDIVSKNTNSNNQKALLSFFEFDLKKGELKTDFILNDFKLSNLNISIPYIGNIGEGNGIFCDGNIILEANDIFKDLNIQVDFDTSVKNINILGNTENIELNFKAKKEKKKIETSDFFIKYSNYNIIFDLTTDIEKKFIDSKFNIFKNDKNILNFLLINDNKNELRIESSFNDGYFNTEIKQNVLGDIFYIDSSYKYKDTVNKIIGQYNKRTSNIFLTSDGLKCEGNLKNNNGVNIIFDEFSLFKDTLKNNEYTLSSLINLRNIENEINFSTSNINVKLNNNSYFSSDISFTPQKIKIDEFVFYTDDIYSGFCNVNIFKEKSLIFEKINIQSEIRKNNNDFLSLIYTSYDNRGTLSLNTFSFDGFKKIKAIPFGNIDLSLSINTDFNKVYTGYAKGHLTTKNNSEDFIDFQASVFDNIVHITDMNVSYSGLKLFNVDLAVNLNTYDVDFFAEKFRFVFYRAVENTNFDTSIMLKGNIKNLIDSSFSISNLDKELVFQFGFKNMNLNNNFFVNDEIFPIKLKKGIIYIDGNTFNGFIDTNNSYLDIHVDKNFLLSFDVSGFFSTSILDLSLKNTYIPIDILSVLLWADSVVLSNGIFTGNVRVTGTLSSPQLFGSLKATKTNIWCMWAENEDMVILDPILYAYGSRVIIPKTKTYAINRNSGRISNLEASFELELGCFDFPIMNLIVDVEKKNPVSLSIAMPVPNLQADIQKAWGHFELTLYKQGWPDIKFDCGADGVVLSPPARYPSWFYNPVVGYSEEANLDNLKYTKLDGKLHFENDVSIMYPNATTPLVKLDIKRGENATIYVNEGKFWADGDVELRGGQIYYFQKGFLINEGNISWHKKNSLNEILYSSTTWDKEIVDAFAGMSLNVNSVLKDYDANGNPVDIYLTLQNASIDNLVPRFSSSTGLTENEIFALLGQNILPANTYTNYGISSLAYMSSVALDVFNSLGTFKNVGVNSIDDTIKRVFGLDTFMIRQRVFFNLLTDIIPDYSGRTVNDSAFARYLNGTTVYLGKNITENLYFQTSLRFITLDKPSYKNKRLGDFFVQGLKTDVEFSFEWSNEVANFSLFTNPTELSFSSFINNIGIGVKKHITF